VATRGTAVYFVLADLAHLNSTYQFSLSWFQAAFSFSIKIGVSVQHHTNSEVSEGEITTSSERVLPNLLEPEEESKLDSRMQIMMDRLILCL